MMIYMKVIRRIWDSITESLGCLGALCAIILPPVLIIGIVSLLTTRCGDGHHSRTKIEPQAYRDSIERVENARQELLRKEYMEHTDNFYDAFNKYYSVFSNPDELREWLINANYFALELIYRLYSRHYDDFSDEAGLDSLADYLFWGPPEYHSYCDQCGSEVYFTDDE